MSEEKNHTPKENSKSTKTLKTLGENPKEQTEIIGTSNKRDLKTAPLDFCLEDEKLGYGKLWKDMREEDYNFFSGRELKISEGIVYKEEDIKKALQLLQEDIHKNGLRNGTINTGWVYDLIKKRFGEGLVK